MTAAGKFCLDNLLVLRKLRFPMKKIAVVAFVACGTGVGPVLMTTQAQTTGSAVLYQLTKDSSFQQGCFAPCLCPVMIAAPVTGTFLLTPTGFDGLFNTYAVTDISWSVLINGTNMSVTGKGTYQVGGEVARQQELSLELQFDGRSAGHFDSGFVAESAPFPEITTTVSTNHQFCFDAVFDVRAVPAPKAQAGLAFVNTNTIVLSWPVSAGPVVLEESRDLSATNWITVTNAPTVVGQQNEVILTRAPGNRFYRLQPNGK